ncbi:MAG TPA: phosphatidate cytidylyltransferase [Oscillospiraceae bacterium]|nr:phosphatidate cytidylyltransferase [Oscillospiraceae bacterium]
MRARILVAVICVPALLAVIFLLPPVGLALLMAALCGVAAHELLASTGYVKNRRILWFSVAAAVLVPLVGYVLPSRLGTTGILYLVFFFLVVLCAILLRDHDSTDFTEIAAAFFGALAVPLLLSSLVSLRLMRHGIWYVLMPIVVAFSADAGALFAGMLFGKRKLAPSVSPKKTVEGAIGGTVTGAVLLLLYGLFLSRTQYLEVRYGVLILYGLAGSLISILGDLTFSVIKRQTGIKDYGRILPGHGGVLDRFDSMVFCAPLLELLILVIPAIL